MKSSSPSLIGRVIASFFPRVTFSPMISPFMQTAGLWKWMRVWVEFRLAQDMIAVSQFHRQPVETFYPIEAAKVMPESHWHKARHQHTHAVQTGRLKFWRGLIHHHDIVAARQNTLDSTHQILGEVR